jgi:hypothetical protein
MLGQGERLTRRETARRIHAWLSAFDGPPILLGDTDWDTTLLAELMDESGITRDKYLLETLVYKFQAQASFFETARQRYFESQHATPHHALTDARAFHAAWHSVFATDGTSDEY